MNREQSVVHFGTNFFLLLVFKTDEMEPDRSSSDVGKQKLIRGGSANDIERMGVSQSNIRTFLLCIVFIIIFFFRRWNS